MLSFRINFINKVTILNAPKAVTNLFCHKAKTYCHPKKPQVSPHKLFKLIKNEPELDFYEQSGPASVYEGYGTGYTRCDVFLMSTPTSSIYKK